MAKKLIVIFVCLSLSSLGCPRVFGNSDDGGIRDCFLSCASSQIGVREATGSNDGLEVEYYLSTVNLGKGYAWCGAFVYSQLIQCVQVVGKPSSFAWVPTWDQVSKRVYDRAKGGWENIKKGDLFLLYYKSLGRVGHIGIVEEIKDSSIVTIEGNTNSAGSREGQGVYRKIRPKRTVYRAVDWIN